MIIISFERLGMNNRQPKPYHTYQWINDQINQGIEFFQSTCEIKVKTERFPEGYVFPSGTIYSYIDEEKVPKGIYTDISMDENSFQYTLRKIDLPKKIGLYHGLNSAPFCLDPYVDFLNLFHIDFALLSDGDIRQGELKTCDLFIVPGGPDAGESYYAGLGNKGMEEIRQYIYNGGRYIGSCAGAYLPLTVDEGTPQHRMWLNVINATDDSGLDYWRTGAGIVRIKLASNDHPTLFSLSYGSPSSLDVVYWEGPMFDHIDSTVKVLATFDEFIVSGTDKPSWPVDQNISASEALTWMNPLSEKRFNYYMKNKPAIIESTYGKGHLILFSFHPEFGSPVIDTFELSPTFLLLMNSVYQRKSLL